ncbi:TPA: hypothetical protein ACTWTN_001955 [Clostridioides difficile]|uniref:hypothetical protein n=1 Tax=Clostridioides difficile TaxID=1496 RepID=UPI00097FD4C1|nr:hypothetical protein [Clostridioides difficile]EIS9446344.1 hypothetical protein [Clostridioides difficile]EIS9594484.1 hypothetical protein [Clostridioides difficile]MBH6834761.1 hypothetical protein [Clostridioides difficile]MBH7226018.1 hypothetical protein [Clostridioides difficile]MBH7275711.1 hypothetical protein [Clostridioides difficile]
MAKLIVSIPLTKYLKDITKEWGETYITKTYGGHVYLSDEAPGEVLKKEDDLNYIEFNDSDIVMRLPKEVHQHINLKKGCNKNLKDVLKEIKKIEEKTNI